MDPDESDSEFTLICREKYRNWEKQKSDDSSKEVEEFLLQYQTFKGTNYYKLYTQSKETLKNEARVYQLIRT